MIRISQNACLKSKCRYIRIHAKFKSSISFSQNNHKGPLVVLDRNDSSSSSVTKATCKSERIHSSFVATKKNGSNDDSFLKPDFNNASLALSSKSTSSLIRSMIVFRICQIPFLVKYSAKMLAFSKQVLGDSITNFVMEHTFYSHFCGGTDVHDVKPKIQIMRQNGVGAILDYAAESDVPSDKTSNNNNFQTSNVFRMEQESSQPARLYDYKNEEACDRHLDIFKSCIHTVSDVSPDGEGFAAIKFTALGNPLLLERLSTAITECQKLFDAFDRNNDGFLTHEEFDRGYRHHFYDADDKIPMYLTQLDPNGTGKIDLLEWSRIVTPYNLLDIVASCRRRGSLTLSTLSQKDLRLIHTMIKRISEVAQEASNCNVRLLIDAEQTYLQPAIDNLTFDLMQKYNHKKVTSKPVLFNTYQCYLKDSMHRLKQDLLRADHCGYHFGVKLVRGAYMHSERLRAKSKGYPSPIHDTIEDTHVNYNKALEYIISYRHLHSNKVELLLGTHNKESIEHTIDLLHQYDNGRDYVYFAQLLGMSDNLTYNLGNLNYKSYKYVPYGKVDEVVPYLVRRIEENGSILGNVQSELSFIHAELFRRLLR